MGKWGLFLFSEEIAQLEEFKKTLSNPAEIAEIDRQIAELRKKMEEPEEE